MKKLYLLRHGQTVFNVNSITQGRVDSPLTDKGIAQANKVKEYFKNNNISFDKVYCSPLGRTRQTCSIVSDIKPIIDEQLIELSFGEIDGKEWSLSFQYNDDYTPIGGESVKSAGDRMYDALLNIANKEGNNLLVVSHGTVLRSFYYKVINKYIKDFRLPNCGLMVVEFDDNKFEIKEIIDPTL